jgi:hypothetical protein
VYRKFTKAEIGRNIRLPEVEIIAYDDFDTKKLDNLLEETTVPKIVDFILDVDIDEETKKALPRAFNWPIGWSSIAKIKDRTMLAKWISQLDMTPSIKDSKAIILLSNETKMKSRKATIYGKWLADEVEQLLKKYGLKDFFISSGGSGDKNWSTDWAGADGYALNIEDKEIIMYFRFGSTSGGSQGDRWTGMYNMAKENPDRLFLFVVEGVESYDFYNKMKILLREKNVLNALWSNLYYLSQINFDEFMFMNGDKE